MKTLLYLATTILATINTFASATQLDDITLVEAGKRIYEQGILPNGKPLEGKRSENFVVKNQNAACILCHRRSGMGLAEGASLVPPISAPALFGKLQLANFGRKPQRAAGITFTDWPFKTRPAYDDISLAKAIRHGVSPDGYEFQYMMPRYDLAESDMNSLIAYLHTLSATPSPGTDSKIFHFATVITPETTSTQRTAFLDVLKSCFVEKFPGTDADASHWKLHTWDLKGKPDSWQTQLEEHYVRQPVFALVSGLGLEEWNPVETYCEANKIPCLFPNTDLPGSQEPKQYSFYFFRGTLLEADVIATHLFKHKEKTELKRIIAVSRPEGAGASATLTLKKYLSGSSLPVEHLVLNDESKEKIYVDLRNIGKTDALVLLLRETDLDLIASYLPEPPQASILIMSGLLGGLEKNPLPDAWRNRMIMTYPFDSPARWNRRMDFNLRPWLAAQDIDRYDERMQGNTLAACNLLYESVLRLRGQNLREYLVENIENYPTFMGNAPAAQAFPRFSIGPGQRYSSKGAHLVRFGGTDLKQLLPVEDWIVP